MPAVNEGILLAATLAAVTSQVVGADNVFGEGPDWEDGLGEDGSGGGCVERDREGMGGARGRSWEEIDRGDVMEEAEAEDSDRRGLGLGL